MKTDHCKSINILYLNHTAKWSGGEIALFRSLSAINKHDFQSNIILAEDGILADKMRSVGVNTEVISLGEKAIELRKDQLDKKTVVNMESLIEYIKYSIMLSKRMSDIKTDLVHCNSLKSDIYGGIAGKISRIPVIWHVRDHISYPYLPKRIVSVFRKLAKNLPSGIITNSESTLNCLFDNSLKKNKSRVIYDGLTNKELNSPPRDPFNSWNKIPNIGILGRIVEWKGQHVFLDAAEILLQRGVVAKYQVIGASLFGEDGYESIIVSKAEKLKSSVELLGFRSDVKNVLQNLDILVHCSILPEPFGQVIIEGMAEGLPVIATNAGGVKEIITHGVDGILSPLGDEIALADDLENLLAQPQYASKLGQKAYFKIREKFTAENSARAIESFYRELL